MVTKKKKSLRTNEEPVHRKKKKRKNDDQEVLTNRKKKKHTIEESTLGGEEEHTVEIVNKKKKKGSKVNEGFTLETFPCSENSDLNIDNEERSHLEPQDETFCKPVKSRKKKKKDRKIGLPNDDGNNEELQKLFPEKIRAKKTKRSVALEILRNLEGFSETDVSGTGNAHGKTKKKKRKKQHKEVSTEEAHNHFEPSEETSCKTENVNKKRKKKRSKDHCIDYHAQTHMRPNHEVSRKPENSKENRKKKHCIENSMYDEQHSNLESKDEASSEPEHSKRKKKKNKSILLEIEAEYNEELQTQNAEKSLPKKKKAKQSKTEERTHQLLALPETAQSGSEEVCEEKIKKKKKKRQENDERIEIALPELQMKNGEWELGTHNLTSTSNKKNKKKMVLQATDSVGIISDMLPNKDTQECGKSTTYNNIKRHMLDNTMANDIPKSKKKKNIKFKEKGGSEAVEYDDEVEVVSLKKGNTDEVHIDQMRRRALQEDVDRASGKVKDSHFGQWQTATFENPDQKNKFLRLLGGFKKFSPSSALSPVGTERPHQALNRIGEEKREQNLLAEFEKAQDLKQHRGIGLGFQPATKKTFYIDKTRSNSLKFDD